MGNAFVTGSRVYGVPNADSDVDLVVLVDERDADILRRHAEEFRSSDDGCGRPGWYAIRFGRLNVILCDQKRFDLWRGATDELIEQRPVTRDFAVSVVKKHLAALDAAEKGGGSETAVSRR